MIDSSDLHYLKNLFSRISYTHAPTRGSDDVTVYRREFEALDQAIKDAEKNPHEVRVEIDRILRIWFPRQAWGYNEATHAICKYLGIEEVETPISE